MCRWIASAIAAVMVAGTEAVTLQFHSTSACNSQYPPTIRLLENVCTQSVPLSDTTSSQYGLTLAPGSCSGANVKVWFYGSADCSSSNNHAGTAIPGAELTIPTDGTCFQVSAPYVATASSQGPFKTGYEYVKVSESTCGTPANFMVGTRCATACGVPPSAKCFDEVLPRTGSCLGTGLGNVAVTTTVAGNNPPTVTVNSFKNDVGCTNVVNTQALPLDDTCVTTTFGSGYGSPLMTFAAPAPATISAGMPLGTIKCWENVIKGSSAPPTGPPVQAPTQTDPTATHCVIATVEMPDQNNQPTGIKFEMYMSMNKVAVAYMYMANAANPMYTDFKVCDTDYCNAPPSAASGASSTTLAMTGVACAAIAATVTLATMRKHDE